MSIYKVGQIVYKAYRVDLRDICHVVGTIESIKGEIVNVRASHIETWRDGTMLASDEYILKPLMSYPDCDITLSE